jgi:hypothetical protein
MPHGIHELARCPANHTWYSKIKGQPTMTDIAEPGLTEFPVSFQGRLIDPEGAENSATSCDLQILVYETSESVSSQRLNGRAGGLGSAACGWVLIE